MELPSGHAADHGHVWHDQAAFRPAQRHTAGFQQHQPKHAQQAQSPQKPRQIDVKDMQWTIGLGPTYHRAHNQVYPGPECVASWKPGDWIWYTEMDSFVTSLNRIALWRRSPLFVFHSDAPESMISNCASFLGPSSAARQNESA